MLALLLFSAKAWNIPAHLLSAAITYEVLRHESPATIEKVKSVLEKHPWYAKQWQVQLQDVPATDHDLMLFMQAARWPDDIRFRDKQHHRGSWHYIISPLSRRGNSRACKPETRSQ
jgi:hypothetical protein